MAGDLVNASPDDIRKLAGALTAYAGEVTAASKRVQGALNSANWHDSQKDKFEARYRDLQKQLDHFMSGEVSQMVKSLNTLAGKLSEIKSMRM